MQENHKSSVGLEQRYPKGTVCEAEVRLLHSFGATVTLIDGTEGIIRNRELSWEHEPEHPQQVLAIGQGVKVLVLGAEHDRPRLELSLRQAAKDPWENLEHRYQMGQVICGKVVRLRQVGAFLELEPAVEGLVPLNEICSPAPEKVDDVLWIGDMVEAVITRMDTRGRQITLSIRQHLSNLKRQREAVLHQEYLKTQGSGLSTLGERISTNQLGAIHEWLSDRSVTDVASETNPRHTLAEQFPKILIADDYASFRNSLKQLLTALGHEVEIADSAEKAVSLCTTHDFNLVVLDLEFRHGHLNGLQATRQLLALKPQLPIVIVTAASRVRGNKRLQDEIKAAGARRVLLKPVDLSALDRALTAIAAGHEDDEPIPLVEFAEELATHFEAAPDLTLAQTDLARALHRELVELQRTTGSQACILFHMAATTREVRVFTHTGTPLKDYEESRYTLQASPIDEVVREGKPFYDPDTSRHPRRYQYLKILNFNACLGVPVRSFEQTEYGLFLFHAQKEGLKEEHLKLAAATAAMIGAIIARKEAERIIQRVQPLVLEAQLSARVIHEMGNRLGGILNHTALLSRDQREIEKAPAKALEPHFRNKLQTRIRDIEKDSKAMAEIMHLYLDLIRTETQGTVQINDTIRRVIRLLQPMAEEHSVKVLDRLEENLPATLAVEVRLEQVFVNLALNAIQHIHHAYSEGELIIQSRFSRDAHQFPLQIRVTDTGPGIHGQSWQRVFELGFSTRSDGTGLGLFITKGLIESMGGKISIEKSTMLVGSTFLVELPLVVPSYQGGAK